MTATKKKLFFLLITFSICHLPFSIAEVRYVSPTGNNIPPYLTWEDAANSIQDAIDICEEGDTVVVANGEYNESIYVDKTINLWGSSADSTIIQGSGTPNHIVDFFETNGVMENFKVIGPGQSVTGITGIYLWYSNVTIKNCKVSSVFQALRPFNSTPIIKNLLISNFIWGIFEECPANACNGIYKDNIIISTGATETPVRFVFGGYPTFTNNIIIEEGNIWTGVDGGSLRGVNLKNNAVSGFYRRGIRVTDIFTDTASIISNNVVHIKDARDSQEGAIVTGTGHRSQIKNNIITNTRFGISGYHSNDSTKGNYNLFWNVQNLTGGNATLGDSNIVADPMFVNDTIPTSEMNFDFHLQAYSPATDKGDPNILDIDESRSDIGMFGGPLGERYVYIDLPPRTPQNFSFTFDSTYNILTLNWDMATEADFSHYNIYRDTASGFTPGKQNLIAQTDTSYFVDDLSKIESKAVYYKITAVDNQENESQPGTEIAVIVTDVIPVIEIIRDYILYQNYPNPFNPSTTISYEIKNRSYVKLMVYDIKGELISVLVNQEQEAGYYEVDFNVKHKMVNSKGDLASGIYLYRIEVIGEGNIPVYSDMKKMIFLK